MPSSNGKVTRMVVIVISILVGALFLLAGGTKLTPGSMYSQHVEDFTRWGYPIWFMYVVGIIEVAGGLSLWIPATRYYASVLLACDMLGAVATHLKAGEATKAPFALILLLLCMGIAYITRPSASKPAAAVS